MARFVAVVVCFVLLPTSNVSAQKKPSAGGFPPDQETMQKIRAKSDELGKALASLKEKGVKDPIVADVEVYHRAAEIIVRNNDFNYADSGKWTLEVLDLGLDRAKLAAEGKFPWTTPGLHTIRAYRSRVDGSVQPYAVTIPPTNLDRFPGRVDVVLHGRNDLLTEVAFLRSHKDKVIIGEATVQIDVFGRGNNAYRWAGETDVFEAMESAGFAGPGRRVKQLNDDLERLEKIADQDPKAAEQISKIKTELAFAGHGNRSKTVLRGFSMGGAGVWHLGLHHPDRWCVIGPGAGFSNTKGLPADHPKIWDKCLTIYDAVDYAANAFNVPVVAYSGGMDPQKAAADNIEARLKTLGLSDKMTHLIAPEQKHVFPADYMEKAEALWAKFVSQQRSPASPEVRFTTYTLKYPKCDWVDILGLERHYEEANVIATQSNVGVNVKTKNVRRLCVQGLRGLLAVKIDGDVIKPAPGKICLEKIGNSWKVAAANREPILEKVHGLQGPIDDAFTDGFLCVQGTQRAWHPATQAYVDKDLARFAYEWSKYMHGDLPIKKDTEVSAADIAGKNLILFGDPASNSLIAKVLKGLPVTWTKDALELAGKKYDPAEYLPVMIYPNPLQAKKYVVLNSGHTFHEAQFKATNAFLFPRLGDYAVVKLAAAGALPLQAEPVEIGLFDEFWKIAEK